MKFVTFRLDLASVQKIAQRTAKPHAHCPCVPRCSLRWQEPNRPPQRQVAVAIVPVVYLVWHGQLSLTATAASTTGVNISEGIFTSAGFFPQ